MPDRYRWPSAPSRVHIQVRLERPSIHREPDFIKAVHRSRSLYRGFGLPPNDSRRYRKFVEEGGGPRNQYLFVVDRTTTRLVGVIQLEQIIRGHLKSAFIGYYAFVPYAGRGFMRQGVGLAVDHAFNQLKLHRLEASIEPDNERSAALARSLGFRFEGTSKKYLKIAGRWRDCERWALIVDEWAGLVRMFGTSMFRPLSPKDRSTQGVER